MLKLKYGNTNTFFIQGSRGRLLVDTDYAGTLPAFCKALKHYELRLTDIEYVLETHYHPDQDTLCFAMNSEGVMPYSFRKHLLK